MDILEEIFRQKMKDYSRKEELVPIAELEAAVENAPHQPSLRAGLQDSSRTAPRLIAEIKRRSPSKGTLRENIEVKDLAQIYDANGASAISILTEERYFSGSMDDLREVSSLFLGLPILQKDFIYSRYQLLEARIAGASGILLITAMLPDPNLANLILEANQLELAPLVEIHDLEELKRAIQAGADVIGVNNRDLHSFAVYLSTSIELVSRIPAHCIKVSESGITNREDAIRLSEAGFDAILIGERLMTSEDIGESTRLLAGRIEAETTRG